MHLRKLPLFDDRQHWIIKAEDEKDHWKCFIADDIGTFRRELYEFFLDVDWQNNVPINRDKAKQMAIKWANDVFE